MPSNIRDQIVSQRLTREMTSSRERRERREKAAAIAARVLTLRAACPPESAWRISEREAVSNLSGGPAGTTPPLMYHVHAQADLGTLSSLPAEVAGAADQSKALARDVLAKFEALQADSELAQSERLDVLLEESARFLDRAETLVSKPLRDTLNEFETRRVERLAALVAGAPGPADVWLWGTLKNMSREEAAMHVRAAAASGDTPVIRAIATAPKLLGLVPEEGLEPLVGQWYGHAHRDDAAKLDVVRRVHEGAVKATATIANAIGEVVDRAVVGALEQGLISASAPAQAQ